MVSIVLRIRTGLKISVGDLKRVSILRNQSINEYSGIGAKCRLIVVDIF